eukprot:2690623-Pleurochrysis_carterae.AAC.1
MASTNWEPAHAFTVQPYRVRVLERQERCIPRASWHQVHKKTGMHGVAIAQMTHGKSEKAPRTLIA